MFAVGVLAVTIALHRLFSLPTPIAINLAIVVFALAALSLLFSIFAAIGIWRTGRPGTSRVVLGTLVALALLLWPLAFLPQYERLPKINDVTTDPLNPPEFTALAKVRGSSANPVAYPGGDFASVQHAAYPDIKPIEINRSVDETFELVADTARRLKLDVVSQQSPEPEKGAPGIFEIVDRTLVLGIYDDVVIRVSGNEEHSRVDIRSASRYGRHDLGRNAQRIRHILKEVVVRLESVPSQTKPAPAKVKQEAKPEQPRYRRQRRRQY